MSNRKVNREVDSSSQYFFEEIISEDQLMMMIKNDEFQKILTLDLEKRIYLVSNSFV